jgi:hypothetical protein
VQVRLRGGEEAEWCSTFFCWRGLKGVGWCLSWGAAFLIRGERGRVLSVTPGATIGLDHDDQRICSSSNNGTLVEFISSTFPTSHAYANKHQTNVTFSLFSKRWHAARAVQF